MMKRKNVALLFAVGLLAATSCNKDLFDEEAYNDLVDYQFMVDNVDRAHDWCLTKNDTITLQASGSIYTVQILTANPYNSATAEIAAEGVPFVWDGNRITLTYTVPVTQSALYAAALREDGSYMGVVPFAFGTKELDLTASSFLTGGTLTQPAYQTFTYLYEVDFPFPGDFDYNDMVLRISKGYTSQSNVVDLTVTLSAAGAAESYGAAIQLVDVSYDDVSSVEIVGGERMDKGYPLPLQFIKTENLLMRGNHGEALIRLFEDAQWVMGNGVGDLGMIEPKSYNTIADSATVSPVTTTYRVTFKDREVARCLTFDRIDPFIVHYYNNANWEVHTYSHKFDEVLYVTFNGDTEKFDNHISWSLVVPKGDFRYPCEGASLCNYNSSLGEVFGPYSGFAYWMMDHTTHQDWYLTPTQPQLLY